MVRPLFPAEVNHRVRNRGVALDVVSAGPEKQVAWLQLIELKRVFMTAVDRPEGPGFPKPDILSAGIARHIAQSILRQDVENEPGAIHPATSRIGRTIFVIEIPGRELERHINDLADGLGVILVTGDLAGRDCGGRALLFGRRRC